MTSLARVLPAQPMTDLTTYRAAGGGRGLDAARRLGPAATVDEIEASGLRGRGGGGFPTGVKWRTVAGNASAATAATVVVNAAEGEPGTFKDRSILRANPFAVVEGAIIAALAVGADRAVFALKETFGEELDLLRAAIGEVEAEGWSEGINLGVATGPGEYLFGEETALLEVLDGRPPFPRIAPPFRHGVDEVGQDPDEPAGTAMARPGAGGAPPTLVDNVETVANVPGILAEGATWFRAVGTPESPGTIVCTITGATARHGVGEVTMGTTLAEVLETIGGGAREDRRLVAAMSGVANPLVPAEHFTTPLTYEHMQAIGSGLGAGGFIVFDDATDFAAVAAGVSRFLAVESCGQCTPCKQDGLAIAEHLARITRSEANDYDLAGVADRVATVADEARCSLATQHQLVIDSILRLFPQSLRDHVEGRLPPAEVESVGPLVGLADGRAEVDVARLAKQPDWTFDDVDSGKTPVERLAAGGDAD